MIEDQRTGRMISNRSLRILVVQNVPHNRRGGMTRILGFIHDRVERDGHTVEFFTSEQLPARLNRRCTWFTFPIAAFRHVRKAALTGRPYDVVNIHEPSAAVMTVFKRFAGNPTVVVTTHGLEERGWATLREDANLGRDRLRWKTRLVYPPTVLWPSRIGLLHADHVFCLNEEDRQRLLTDYCIRSDKVTRMFPAADSAYLGAFPQRDYADPPDRLLWFGTWIPRKGSPDAVAAFSALAPMFPDLKLVVMGAGVPAEMVHRVFPESLRERVEYVPYATGVGVADYAAQMIRAAVYVLPSVFEGTPLTLMETMATGLPPVSTAVCGMKDVIRDGENGLLVPVRSPSHLVEAIGRLLSDPRLRERLGRQAHSDVVERFTWDKVAEPVRAVYQTIAAQRGKP